MRLRIPVVITVVITITIVITCILLYAIYHRKFYRMYSLWGEKPTIYAIMVTSGDEHRRRFIPSALKNFHSQTYPNKKLMVVNHGKETVLHGRHPDVIELFVDKYGKTLGDLRNIALQHVPPGGLWITFDDDDLRSEDYLSLQYDYLRFFDADAVALRNGMTFNLNNGYIYKNRFEEGMYYILMKNFSPQLYSQRDDGEDSHIRDVFIPLKKKMVLIDNDPLMYIRTFHGKNTSKYVDQKKDAIFQSKGDADYKEFPVTAAERNLVIDTYNRRKAASA